MLCSMRGVPMTSIEANRQRYSIHIHRSVLTPLLRDPNNVQCVRTNGAVRTIAAVTLAMFCTFVAVPSKVTDRW
jgi:hypothetical protein